MRIGKRIKQLREKFKLKQIDLANTLRVSPQAVSKWEREENDPDVQLLVRIAEIFSVSTDYLLGVGEPNTGIIEATVFCTGLKGYARLAEEINEKDMADKMNVFFHHLTEIVLKYDGVPVKYVGDGFLSFFSGSAQVERAVKAALHAKRIINDDNLIISLNKGEIYLGTIGHPNYSSTDICGKTVNSAFLLLDSIASRTESGIGTTSAVSNVLGKDRCKKHSNIRLPQIDSEIDMFEILS